MGRGSKIRLSHCLALRIALPLICDMSLHLFHDFCRVRIHAAELLNYLMPQCPCDYVTDGSKAIDVGLDTMTHSFEVSPPPVTAVLRVIGCRRRLQILTMTLMIASRIRYDALYLRAPKS